MKKPAVALVIACAITSLAPVAHGAGVSPGVATPVQREQAQSLFQRGKGLFDAHRYSEALAAFRAALDIVATPNARLYVARCLRETGKLVAAYVEFDRTAVEAKEHEREDSRYARTGSSAEVERDAIVARIGFIQLRVDHATDATTLRIAGEELRRAGWGEPVPALPGDVEIVVETAPSPPIRKTVTIAPGDKQLVVLDAAPAPVVLAPASSPPPPGALRPYAYVAGGVGLAGLVTFAIAGLLSDSAYGDLSSQCGGRACPVSKQSEISRGQAEQTAANVGLGFGLAGLAAGVSLFVVSLPKRPSHDGPVALRTLGLSVVPGGLGARGTF